MKYWHHIACASLALAAATPIAAHAQEAAADVAAPLNSVAAEIKKQVGGRLRGFYRPRGYWPLWVKGGAIGPQAEQFIELASTADLDGVDPRRYKVDDLRRAVDAAQDGSPVSLARAELKLSLAFADYVRDVRRKPLIKITYLDPELIPERQREDEVLRIAALAPSFEAYVQNVGWMSPYYLSLRTALAGYRERWAELPDLFIPPLPKKMRVGFRGEPVALLRRRLGLPEGTSFDKALATRLRAFQADHGLGADGVPGERTVAALNRDPADYERILRLNLERARILPGPWVRHVVVNAAAARLSFYDSGKEQGTMRVVVGTLETQTPMLAGMVRYAILNPYWNVPTDLVQKRIAPKVLGGASFKSLRYEALSDWGASASLLDPAQIDWQAVAAGQQELRVRQLPGGANAMGRVKFMFPNDLGIYLHDTPDKSLFSKTERQFSNGCVRLEDAPRLGKWFFGKALAPASDAPEQNVALPDPVPVYLTYLTAVPTERGITFIDDPYGRDVEQLQQLAAR
ncbi:MAG: putative L,D-transpeptidase YcbB [Sphingomonas bacterium]|nr:putative L,D-transpeptidase YcbB [Sphingomonas bacterium]